jgi:hypothetical protein
MIYAVAVLAIAVFMIALIVLRIVAVAKTAINTSREVRRTLTDPELGDEHREQAMQKASLSLLGNFISITLRGAAALALSYLTLLAADATGMARLEDVVSLLSSWEAIVVTTIVLTAAWLAWNKR